MHATLFSIKRTFHKTTWFGRDILEPFDRLTPSRFDILYILETRQLPYIWQSTIRKILGVIPITTSIMVRALERLGLVQRRKSEDDRRQVEVSLTERGRALIRRAIGALRTKKIIDYFISHLVCAQWWDESAVLCDVEALQNQLMFTRRKLKDRANLFYPWHPDD